MPQSSLFIVDAHARSALRASRWRALICRKAGAVQRTGSFLQRWHDATYRTSGAANKQERLQRIAASCIAAIRNRAGLEDVAERLKSRLIERLDEISPLQGPDSDERDESIREGIMGRRHRILGWSAFYSTDSHDLYRSEEAEMFKVSSVGASIVRAVATAWPRLSLQ